MGHLLPKTPRWGRNFEGGENTMYIWWVLFTSTSRPNKNGIFLYFPKVCYLNRWWASSLMLIYNYICILVQLMACHLLSTKPSSKPILVYTGSMGAHFSEAYMKMQRLALQKYIWKWYHKWPLNSLSPGRCTKNFMTILMLKLFFWIISCALSMNLHRGECHIIPLTQHWFR